jgi:hypothetical protein
MYKPLAPCPGCHRHVRAAEGACPFCGATLVVAHTVPSATTRLARGAMFVFASSIAACGASTEPEPVTADTGAAADSRTDALLDYGNIAPPYGIPPTDSGADDGTVDDTGGTMAKYGAPPIPDASTD